FRAEDGIRDFHVTGVQTCALPIWQEGLETVGIELVQRRQPMRQQARRDRIARYRGDAAEAGEVAPGLVDLVAIRLRHPDIQAERSEEHTSELQSRENIVCRLLLEK